MRNLEIFMGCIQSAVEPAAPDPGEQGAAGVAAAAGAGRHDGRERSEGGARGGLRPSTPLRLPGSWRSKRPMTRAELDNQREEFWHTRVEGIAQIWDALRACAEALDNEDLGLASAIVEASQITLPDGALQLCYDERGNEYAVPTFCTRTPSNLLVGQPGNNSGSNCQPPPPGIQDGGESKDCSLAAQDTSVSKTPPLVANKVNIRVRTNLRELEVKMAVGEDETAQALLDRVIAESKQPDTPLARETSTTGIAWMGSRSSRGSVVGVDSPTETPGAAAEITRTGVAGRRPRLFYAGRELGLEQTVGSARIQDGTVVQLVVPVPSS